MVSGGVLAVCATRHDYNSQIIITILTLSILYHSAPRIRVTVSPSHPHRHRNLETIDSGPLEHRPSAGSTAGEDMVAGAGWWGWM
jgi:hypothetical protein